MTNEPSAAAREAASKAFLSVYGSKQTNSTMVTVLAQAFTTFAATQNADAVKAERERWEKECNKMIANAMVAALDVDTDEPGPSFEDGVINCARTILKHMSVKS